MEWSANWIWVDKEAQPINAQVCFRKTLAIENYTVRRAVLRISGDTLFRVWIDGVGVGDGPIRSSKDHWYYEEYAVEHLLTPGEHLIAAQVWHYGHSNYQYVENHAGLIASLEVEYEDGRIAVYPTDASWKAHVHLGYEKHVPKRNVNIGWLEVYDARRWDADWIKPSYDDADWTAAHIVCEGGAGPWGELYPRDIEPMAKRMIFPRQLVSESEVLPIQKVVSVNMREHFFPGQRDANVKIFTGYFATGLEVAEDTRGKLTFAHTPWNGVQGRYKIDGQWFATGDEFHLTKGKHLFLVEIGGVHNDVFSHMEWDFPVEVKFIHPMKGTPEAGESAFVTLGPYQVIEAIADGKHPKYGGVEKLSGLDKELPEYVEVGKLESLEAFRERYAGEVHTVASSDVMDNLMIYSLMLRRKQLACFAVKRDKERMLYDHAHPTVVPVPSRGGDMEYVVDFGKLYVGRVELELEAPEGTIVDVYGFEAMVDGKIRYTSGLNNAFRYTTRAGRQQYVSDSRMGFRYLILTVREQTAPVSIYRIAVEQSGYPVTDQAVFRCSDPLLNDIWEISRHTSEVCTEDTFVDCPTFERVFWVGDCRVSALVNYYLFGSYDLVRHCLELVPRSREHSPLLLSCLPTDWQAVIPVWTFSWMMSCKDYVEYSGDHELVASIYPEYVRTLEAYCEFLDDRDLFDISSWNMLDWAEVDIPAVGVGTAQHAMLAYCCELGADMAAQLGLKGESERWYGVARRMRIAMHRYLWDPKRQAFYDGQHRTGEMSKTYSHQTHVLLYLCQAIDKEHRPLVEKHIVQPPEDWVQIISPFMSFYLFEAWQSMGRLDLILERIREVWGTMVRQGSTTAWETYPSTRSFAHAWSAAPAYVMGKHLLGVNRTGDGFLSVELAPPETELEWAEGSIPTPLGRIDVSWSREKGERKLRAKLPESIAVDCTAARRAGWEIELERFID